MSKMSNLALEQEEKRGTDNDYWADRCYDLEEKYNNLVKKLADELANLLVEEIGGLKS